MDKEGDRQILFHVRIDEINCLLTLWRDRQWRKYHVHLLNESKTFFKTPAHIEEVHTCMYGVYNWHNDKHEYVHIHIAKTLPTHIHPYTRPPPPREPTHPALRLLPQTFTPRGLLPTGTISPGTIASEDNCPAGNYPRCNFPRPWFWLTIHVPVMVFSLQSKTTTRQWQDKRWTCACLWCLSHQVRHVWHHRNAQVNICLVVVLLWCENTSSHAKCLILLDKFNNYIHSLSLTILEMSFSFVWGEVPAYIP